jgi:hypothetical protein
MLVDHMGPGTSLKCQSLLDASGRLAVHALVHPSIPQARVTSCHGPSRSLRSHSHRVVCGCGQFEEEEPEDDPPKKKRSKKEKTRRAAKERKVGSVPPAGW